jgi:hypothetical protein
MCRTTGGDRIFISKDGRDMLYNLSCWMKRRISYILFNKEYSRKSNLPASYNTYFFLSL